MANALIKIKIMPESPDTNLNELKTAAQKTVEKIGGIFNKTEIQAIAFGLNAVIVIFSLPEEKGTNIIEENFNKIEKISSAEIVDYRREFG